MRLARVIALACVGCQGSASQAPAPAPAPAPPVVVVAEPPPDAAAPPAPPPPIALPAAGHGGHIVAVALADDGRAALTIDTRNGVRLWPALDGTREPVAVPVVAPAELVLARDGDGFAIAALDSAGGLAVLRVDGADRLTGSVALPHDPPYVQVVAAGGGFLAVRADQTIERLAATGARLGAVTPAAGQQIARVIARRGRALALVTTSDGVVGRWLDTTADLAWGADTPALEKILPGTAVLSPDHLRLAALQLPARRSVIVELATGAVEPVHQVRPALVPLGWTAADRVAFVHDDFEHSTVHWYDETGRPRASIGDDFQLEFLTVLAMEAADDAVVSFLGGQLVLVAPRRLRYLGYQHDAATRLEATPAGIAAVLGGRAELLDADLASTRRVAKSLPIDDTLSLALRRGELALLDGTTPLQVVKLTGTRLHYEPATRLVAVERGAAITFLRLDPIAKRFGEPIAVPVAAKIRELALLDPARADGAIALVTSGRVARAIHEDELTGAPPREPIALPGEPVALDRAGHIYVRRDASTIAVHAGAQEIGRLTRVARMSIRPAPDGERVAIFGRGRLIVAALDGTPRWSIGVPGIDDVAWTAAGELVVLATGIARLDADTGERVAARCGWKLALRNQPDFRDPRGSTLCD